MCWKRIILLFLSFLALYAFPQDYNFRSLTTTDGLAQDFVYCIIQDAKGYLWIGTGNGLSRYNGFKFENFTTRDSLSGNFITCGIRDGDCLWFGHMNGNLSFFDGSAFHTVKIPLHDGSPVTHFAVGPDGHIWAGTYSNGIFRLDKKTKSIQHFALTDQVNVVSFEFINDSLLLAGTNTGLLYCKLNHSGKITTIRPVSGIPDSKITCILKKKNKNGFYVAAENEGIYSVSLKSNHLKISQIKSEKPGINFSGSQVLYEDNKSNLWVGTFGNGLIKITFSGKGEPGTMVNFKKSNGFASDNIKSICEDRDGDIWSGNYGDGLTQITPRTLSLRSFDKTRYGDNAISLFCGNTFRWLGTGKGLIKTDIVTGKVIEFYGTESGLPEDLITGVFSFDEKEIWIGTGKNGVFRLNTTTGQLLKYPIETGILENSVTCITGNKDHVWIGTKKGLCRINTLTDSVEWFSIYQGGLPHNYINSLFVDKNGRLWVTTRSNTLAYIRDNKVFKVPVYSLSGNFTLGMMTEDDRGRLWVGSNGNGVFMVKSDSVVNFTTKNGLLSDYCYSIVYDRAGCIWVGHKGGLSRIRLKDFSIKKIQQIFGLKEKTQFNSNAACADQNGIVCFGTEAGLVTYNPAQEYSWFLPPILEITSITINDEEQAFSDKIVLSPGYYKIKINFLGISLKEPEQVSYQYKLNGYDQWSEISKDTSVTYYHLTEGRYTFLLKASSGDGVVTKDPLILHIIIKKPLWEKWWFYIIGAVLLAIIILGYIKRREYQLLLENRKLEKKVQERTLEIQHQKDEIEKQRDLINEKNANITSSIKYASRIQNAVLPPLELVDKYLPDNFILSKPKDIVSGDFYWLTEKESKIVFAVADCTGHGIPGAFMSLLGITLLNEIVEIQGITRSDAIVTKLGGSVIHSLQQGRKDLPTLDGIDIALCVLDKHKRRIQYTGGMNDMVYITDGKLEVLKADRLSVSLLNDDSEPFTMLEIGYKKGDAVYLFSDGYQDQFGGPYDKKYLTRRFYGTLLEIHQLPMMQQKKILEQRLHEWMGDHVQTDDITVFGIRL